MVKAQTSLYGVGRPPYARRDMAIGLAVAFLVIFGGAWISEQQRHGPPPPVKKKEEHVVQLVMPPPPPEEQEPVDDTQEIKQVDIAPPMQTDVPQMVTPTSFVQKLEPPPPEGMTIDKSRLTVSAGMGAFNKGGQIFDLSMLDQQPVATYQPQPNYPYEMKKQGISGQVVVEFLLYPDGTVHNAFAVSSTQHEFEANAIQAVTRWRFKPGRRGGRAVITRMQVPIVFTLSNDE
ncbi:MAG TPA: TonB family protein [Opitutaceae bacterium]|nr:TonB family protein [Opitutaceae bacterium]